MAGEPGSLGLLALWFLLLGPAGQTLNLQADAPTVYSGPKGSYFGFALDFFQDSKGSMNVVVGAPRANTSQPNVIEAGAVYLCRWAPSGSRCTPIAFDAKGDQVENYDSLTVTTFKSKQWFGASVNTWKDNIVACAPLQHWNAFDSNEETTKTPVGSCFLATQSMQHFAEYSPCRDSKMHSVYRSNILNDMRYCELGFSGTISDVGKLLLGAPGGYYFGGLVHVVDLSAVQSSLPRVPKLLWRVGRARVTEDDISGAYNDGYRGYSVAFGEFNDNSDSPEYVVGVPRKNSQGVVASYFGHTVSVADINGDGKDDILVGAPLFMEHRPDHKLYEVGRVYLYLQRKVPHAYSKPQQTLTGTDVYGRFGMAVAPLGDVNQDGYNDIAVGAPLAGKEGGGCVYIYHGQSDGLTTSHQQILESPFSAPASFGFAVRGASDIDANGYPDVLVGAYAASRVAVYRARPIVVVKAQVVMPDALNPENKTCTVLGAQVSCFNIQMCVGVSGKNIPQKIGLDASLELDRMKQKFGRRVFVLQTSQSSQTFLLERSGNVPQTCQNVTAYLRNETGFKDKLSPIVVSLKLSLASDSGAGELQPVLVGQVMVQEQTRIVLDCGEDNICIPDLQLSARTDEGSLLIGTENVILIQVTATNAGEGAYETELVVQLPHGAYFQKASSSQQKLFCNSRRENETRLEVCEVGNPMKSDTEIKVDVEISVSQLEEARGTITFMLQLRSKNSHNSNSNVEWLQVPVKVAARMTLLGNSAPATLVVPLLTADHKNKSGKANDFWPKVEHIYQLQNKGPSTVSGAELRVSFPSRFRGGFLLYIVRVSTGGNVTCFPSNETNPLQLEIEERTTATSPNRTAQLRRLRDRREVASEAGLPVLEETTVNCSSQACAVLHCQVGVLEKGQGATVTIHAVLWLHSFQKGPLEQFHIQSDAWFSTLGMPYRIVPDVLPSGSSVVHTWVERVNPDAERSIPVWWIIVAVLAGLVLLAAFITILWKMGFFKRKRPPTEEEEELANDAASQSEGEDP